VFRTLIRGERLNKVSVNLGYKCKQQQLLQLQRFVNLMVDDHAIFKD
jgi:hypothetical protein